MVDLADSIVIWGPPETFLLSRGALAADTVYDHGKDTQEFYKVSQVFLEAMKNDRCSIGTYEVRSVSKAMLPDDVLGAHRQTLASLKHPDMVTRLYYCGGADRPQRMLNILKTGFYTSDFTEGDYGEGLYFSKYPSRAAEFSVLGKLIIAEVGLGNIKSVTTKDRKRKAPQDGHDSIVTPGRLTAGADSFITSQSQEFVLFSAVQAIPLYLLEYASKTK
ncbi:hypothetical protein LSAT2_000627 [Lamellibrachia satsuma]|nr:hypothetical protein LSAT2_000627 [Lamellibrachia satsuma]